MKTISRTEFMFNLLGIMRRIEHELPSVGKEPEMLRQVIEKLRHIEIQELSLEEK